MRQPISPSSLTRVPQNGHISKDLMERNPSCENRANNKESEILSWSESTPIDSLYPIKKQPTLNYSSLLKRNAALVDEVLKLRDMNEKHTKQQMFERRLLTLTKIAPLSITDTKQISHPILKTNSSTQTEIERITTVDKSTQTLKSLTRSRAMSESDDDLLMSLSRKYSPSTRQVQYTPPFTPEAVEDMRSAMIGSGPSTGPTSSDGSTQATGEEWFLGSNAPRDQGKLSIPSIVVSRTESPSCSPISPHTPFSPEEQSPTPPISPTSPAPNSFSRGVEDASSSRTSFQPPIRRCEEVEWPLVDHSAMMDSIKLHHSRLERSKEPGSYGMNYIPLPRSKYQDSPCHPDESLLNSSLSDIAFAARRRREKGGRGSIAMDSLQNLGKK